MVKVRYVPCLFEDRRIEFETHNRSLRAILLSLCKKYPETRKDLLNGISIRVNGRKIPPTEIKDLRIQENDRVTIIQEIGVAELTTFLYVWIGYIFGYTATTLAVAKVVAWAAVIASVAYSIYTTVATPKPSRGNLPSRNPLDNSPTYGWEGIRMSMDTRIPVPIVYGEHFIGGNYRGKI